MKKLLSTASFRSLGRKGIIQQNKPRRITTVAQNSPYFKISEEIREALSTHKPIVALETTIYTHGFPFPDNVALSSELESIVRENGGVPATIGILDGVARVGLSSEEINRLASMAGRKGTLKISRRDLSYACSLQHMGKPLNGGTTIAATMILAHMAGIKVFATGGLGGVHRGGELTMDVSADLTELGRTPIALICSGCKGFLDISKTLEYLETQGVGVATFSDGRENSKVEYPAFWARESGVKSPMVIKTEIEAASMIHAQFLLGITSGLHFANPISQEAAIPKTQMDLFINEAIEYANKAGVHGKDNTPFILDKIKDLTKGKSVEANRALVVSNVMRGTVIARELVKIEKEQYNSYSRTTSKTSVSIPVPDYAHIATNTINKAQSPTLKGILRPEVIVAGALAVDYACDFTPFDGASSKSPNLYTSNPSAITQSLGGVGHNIARAAQILGRTVSLCSIVGNDLAGRTAIHKVEDEGLISTQIYKDSSTKTSRTAQYVAINDLKKDLVLAMADMGILEMISPTIRTKWQDFILQSKPKWFVADANLEVETLLSMFRVAKLAQTKTAFEPVSTAKAKRLFSISGKSLPVFPNHLIDIATPNLLELTSIHSAARSSGFFDGEDWWAVIDAMGIPSTGVSASAELVNKGIPQQIIQLLPFCPNIITKLGSQGILLTMLLDKDDQRLQNAEYDDFILSRSKLQSAESQIGGIYMRAFSATQVDADKIVSVNGVGDTFLGALISELVESEGKIEAVVDFAQRAAAMTLFSTEAVHPELQRMLDS